METSRRIPSEKYDDGKWCFGYLNWYCDHLAEIAAPYYRAHPSFKDELRNKLLQERWHFSVRIGNTHPDCIPELLLLMKAKGFVKEVADKFLEERRPVQLEFDFGN